MNHRKRRSAIRVASGVLLATGAVLAGLAASVSAPPPRVIRAPIPVAIYTNPAPMQGCLPSTPQCFPDPHSHVHIRG